MECNQNGRKCTVPAEAGGRGFKRKCGARAEDDVQLAFAAAVPGAPSKRPMRVNLVPSCPADLPISAKVQPTNCPFMNNMDEISYWIYTKRAPCLFNYDNIVKKQVEQAQCSKIKPASVKSKNAREPRTRKKRKLKLLDEDSVSTEKQQNIYFKTTQNQKNAPSSCKSDTLGSDIDFNIKNSSLLKKPKKMKLQRNRQLATTHKKNEVATSTPKTVKLRRSLRRAQQLTSNSNVNSSFEIFNTSVVNGKQELQVKEDVKPEKIVSNDQIKIKVMEPVKGKNELVLNGQFEDMSDVSGFTANYIRSTKMQSSKRPRKLKHQNSRTLMKRSKQREQHDKMIMCVNKSVNTGLPDAAGLNCSTDSSPNVVKLVTLKNNEISTRVNKSTSSLKFLESNLECSNTNVKIHKRESKNNVNISFQSRSSGASRYPKRHKNSTSEIPEQNCSPNVNNSKVNSSSRKFNMRKGKTNSNRKENSEEKFASKRRSGRRIGLKLDFEESGCSMQQLNSSTEQVSSSLAINVACPNVIPSNKNNSTSRCLRSRTCRAKSGQISKDSTSDGSNAKHSDGIHCTLDKSTPKCVRQVKKTVDKVRQSLSRDSLRDKSGFAACFSDSDSDGEPLKQRKFFC